MRREIKFRVWTEVRHELLGMQYFTPDNGAGIVNDTIMQFIGLKDRNGKEIYQGDILKITADKEGYGSTSYGGFAEVTRQICGYSFEVFNPTLKELDEQWRKGGDGYDSSSLWHIDNPEYIEIIGNIYENPNLLPSKETVKD